MVYLGTLGLSYSDWVRNFYLVDMPKREWLVCYAAIPDPSSLETIAEKTGDGFLSKLGESLPKTKNLDRIAEETFVFANNHWRGQVVSTIRQLPVMLD